MTERRDDVGIVVSELLTNAVRHAPPRSGQSWPRWRVQLGLLQPGPCVLCAVADPSPSTPIPRTPDYLAETGRGLQVVDVLSDEWGYITCTTSHSTAKVVWAMFVTLPGRAAQL
jgi:anti-sigma regulatory factor (Ser/Thr protein kinase)